MSEPRNKWGALPGYCPCGEPLNLEEMDFNDGLCDECAAGDADEGQDDDDDWRDDHE